jgi:hypothetical protein
MIPPQIVMTLNGMFQTPVMTYQIILSGFWQDVQLLGALATVDAYVCHAGYSVVYNVLACLGKIN